MKTLKLAAQAAIALTALSIHAAAFATQPSASGKGTAAVRSAVSGNFALGGSGSSTSYAQNIEKATASVTTTASHTPDYRDVHAGISGATSTESYGKAYNASTGAGTGAARSGGSANTAVRGNVAIHGVSQGFNGGHAGTHTHNAIRAGANQGSYVIGQTNSGFDTQLHYTKAVSATPVAAGAIGGSRSAAVLVSSQATGYAGGANAYGALSGMNAAGLARIGASGHFFANADLKARTGLVTAP